MVMIVPGPVSDVQGLVFSPVSVEVSERSYQPRQSVPGPVTPVVVVARLVVVVHLREGGEHEARHDRGEGSDGERRQTDSCHGQGRHRDPDYHVGQHVPLLVHGHVVDHVDSPGDHVPVVRLGGGVSLSLRRAGWCRGGG